MVNIRRASPEARPAKHRPDQRANKTPQLSRRQLLLGLGAVGLVEGFAANEFVTGRLWPYSRPTLTELPVEPPKSARHAATIVFGGLGTRDARNDAAALAPSFRRVGRICSIDYGTGIDDEQNAALINRYVAKNRITELNLEGVSMGLLAVAGVLPQLDLERTGTRVNRLIADCSPVSKADVRDQVINDTQLIDLLDGLGGLGYIGKLASNFWSDYTVLHQLTPHDIAHQTADAWDKTMNNVPPSLWIQQVARINLSSVTAVGEAFSSVDHQAIIHLRPRNPLDDAIVNDISGGTHLEEADILGGALRMYRGLPVSEAPMITVLLNNTSHASPTEHPMAYNAGLGPALEQSALPYMQM